MKLLITVCIAACLIPVSSEAVFSQSYDTTAVTRIIDEGTNRSHAMEALNYLSNVIGPRLIGSEGYNRAVRWTMYVMDSLGMKNVHVEGWGPFGRSWELKSYNAELLEPQYFPLHSYPEAWSPGLKGVKTEDLVYLNVDSVQDLARYHGKLKGKFVLFDKPRKLSPRFTPLATRTPDSTLLKLSNAGPPGPFDFRVSPEIISAFRLQSAKLGFCLKEGAIAILKASRGDDGNIFVANVLTPVSVDTPSAHPKRPWAVDTPDNLPQISVSAEQYNRLVALVEAGMKPKLRMELRTEFTKPDSGYNVIGEIPGTDLKDEIVMIGAHLDSWHGGTGATDDGTGVAACLEAMRIIKALGLQPRRTIRVALWDGEEEGLLGSLAYAKRHFGSREGGLFAPTGEIKLKPEAEHFTVYFNDDNGAGKIRGIYLQGNEAARPIFRGWFKPFERMGASAISLSNTGGTDHLSFDMLGLPAFQFIQDWLDYGTITHHSIMDVYERVPEEDMKQASIIMAAFAYDAAMMDGKFPRKQHVKKADSENPATD